MKDNVTSNNSINKFCLLDVPPGVDRSLAPFPLPSSYASALDCNLHRCVKMLLVILKKF